MKNTIAFSILAISLVACSPITPGSGVSTAIVVTAEMSTVVPETAGSFPTAGPSPTPVPATAIPTLPSSTLSPTELKYRILDRFQDFFFCDPDFYPIAREDEMSLAQQRFAELQDNQEEFQTILSQNNISDVNNLTPEQKLLIYREHKKLNAIFFEVAGNTYRFQIQTGVEGQQGLLITGTIDASGSIEIQDQVSSIPSCPICLATGTLIDTPHGAVRVEDLRVGDPVWTLNAAGERVTGKILKSRRTRVPANHQVVHIRLSDGHELWASPGHPTADGRRLGDLRLNDSLNDTRIIVLESLPYDGTATFDILPAGDTGFYWANGMLMGSTLTGP